MSPLLNHPYSSIKSLFPKEGKKKEKKITCFQFCCTLLSSFGDNGVSGFAVGDGDMVPSPSLTNELALSNSYRFRGHRCHAFSTVAHTLGAFFHGTKAGCAQKRLVLAGMNLVTASVVVSLTYTVSNSRHGLTL